MKKNLSPTVDPLENVHPTSPLAGYIGGKRILSRLLIPRINMIPHEVYAEPFVGMGGVFLRRSRRPKVEAINDYSKDIITLFRVVHRHPQALMDALKWGVTSRDEFNRWIAINPDALTDIDRAARFLYLQTATFGGKVAGRTFGISTGDPAPFNVKKLIPRLEAAHNRLSSVYIECLDWRAFIARWDRPQTLFFVDPPYHGSEHYYGDGFTRSDFKDLSMTLRGIKGRFILTLNDVHEVRQIFGWAKIEAVDLNYCCSGKPTPAREVIITPS